MTSLERILLAIKKEDSQSADSAKNPFSLFTNKFNNAFEAQKIIEENSDSDEVKQLSRENLIINTVTGCEVFFKQSVKALTNIEPFQTNLKTSGLLDEKITIAEAFELNQRGDVTPGKIIASKKSFMDLGTINNVFTLIVRPINGLNTKDAFFKAVESVESTVYTGEESKLVIKLSKDHPLWQAKVAKLFELRHKYVHNIRQDEKLTIKEMNSVIFDLVSFLLACETYFSKLIDESS